MLKTRCISSGKCSSFTRCSLGVWKCSCCSTYAVPSNTSSPRSAPSVVRSAGTSSVVPRFSSCATPARVLERLRLNDPRGTGIASRV